MSNRLAFKYWIRGFISYVAWCAFLWANSWTEEEYHMMIEEEILREQNEKKAATSTAN